MIRIVTFLPGKIDRIRSVQEVGQYNTYWIAYIFRAVKVDDRNQSNVIVTDFRSRLKSVTITVKIVNQQCRQVVNDHLFAAGFSIGL